MPKKQLKGTIISDKMAKTVVVKVETIKEHSKYKRRFRSHKNYKAHLDLPNEDGSYKIGSKVLIEETRPISKDKKWKVIKLI